jgi:hypothetical protein
MEYLNFTPPPHLDKSITKKITLKYVMGLLVFVLRDSLTANQNFQTVGGLFFSFTECLFNVS